MEVTQLINWWHLRGEIVFLALDTLCIVLVLILSKLKNNKVWWWLSPMIILTLLIIPDIVNKRNVVNTLFWLSFISSISVFILFFIYLIIGDWRRKEEIGEFFQDHIISKTPEKVENEKTAVELGDLNNTVVEIYSSNKVDEEEKTHIIKKKTQTYAWLVGMSGKNKGKQFDLKDDINSIGRGSKNDIIIDDDSVSREHAKIKYFEDEDKYKIYDLVSTNGTYVNGKKIEIPTEIKDGDKIEFGEAIFIFKTIERNKIKQKEGEGYGEKNF